MQLTTTDSAEVKLVKALVIGRTGIGKTTSLLTLPRDKTLVVGVERGLLPLRNKKYATFTIQNWQDVRELLSALRKSNGLIDEARKLVGDDFEMKVVAIDSLSAIAEMCKEQITGIDRKELISKKTGGKTESLDGIYDEQMTMADWGLFLTRMTQMTSAFVKLPYHIIFTCLSQFNEDKETGAIMWRPGIQGRFGDNVGAYFDLILHMENGKTADGKETRVWRTAQTASIVAKDASGALSEFEMSCWPKVFAKILKPNGTTSDKQTKKKGAKK